MAATNHILELWNMLEVSQNMGIEKRLYSSRLPFHIFATWTYDDKEYGIAFSYPDRINVDVNQFQTLKKLRVDLYDDRTLDHFKLLVIQLLEPTLKESFSWLCESLVTIIKGIDNDDDMVRTVIGHVDKWRSLFEKHASDGLSPALQQGLYGELGFLKTLLTKSTFSIPEVVEYWVGSEPALRDFQGDSWAVEVKTSAGNNPQGIIISSERQLDETLFNNLFLLHISLEKSRQNGESLPERVASIRALLENEPTALTSFNAKLVKAGYFNEDEGLYLAKKYKTRDCRFYRIEKDFPRIKEQELRDGVGEITYKIVLSACTDYRKPETEVLRAIQKND